MGKATLELIYAAFLLSQFILPKLQVLLQLPAVFLQPLDPAFLELNYADTGVYKILKK
ncbi:MAG: hypothetical protein NTY37_05400 [Methanothrix sp.]|nr:hypothetical protein [Methanothrix sp.]